MLITFRIREVKDNWVKASSVSFLTRKGEIKIGLLGITFTIGLIL
jgi:hypothetical protein